MAGLPKNLCENDLSKLHFKNTGVVTKSMQFDYALKPCFYVEDLDTWSTPWGEPWDKSYRYLFQIEDGKMVDPTTGMRSAVPLGGLGAGTIELRADGSFRDWNIFNNSPAGGGQKVHLDAAFFGLRTRIEDKTARAWTLRTHPSTGLPPITQIEYAGAFPVSRLRFTDPELPLCVDLYAYSEFRMFNPQGSATPAVIFTFNLHNPSVKTVEVSMLFNLPNHIGGEFRSGASLILSKGGNDPTSGSMALRVADDNLPSSWAVSNDLIKIWQTFSDTGRLKESSLSGVSGDNGALATTVNLAPKECRTVTFIMSWYFPYRTHGKEIVGNNYINWYKNADDVASKVATRLTETRRQILEWNKWCFENSLPDWLQDTIVNSVATMYKTGMWFADGRWRQWESFSCPAVEPVHIHFYRCLPYAFIYPSLQRHTLEAYASKQTEEGYIQEFLGSASSLDDCKGRMMGDTCTTFLLEVYQYYLWTGDENFLSAIWPSAKKAAQWQINRSVEFDLPNRLNNTYDWWKFDDKDLVAYNAFLHLAALLAAEKMAEIKGDSRFANLCRRNLETAQVALEKYLWTGKYFRAWWNKGQPVPNALHADTLYGQLWAEILNLGWTADPDKIKSHLAAEYKINESPYGLKVMRNTGYDDADPGSPPHTNNLVWEAGSLDWAALNIYLRGDLDESLDEAAKIINKWRHKLRDQWNYRDLSTAWDGYPWCNSHYARQLILWATPLALSGQHYSAPEQKLSFNVKLDAPVILPFYTPSANGTIELTVEDEGGSQSIRLMVLHGKLDLKELEVSPAPGLPGERDLSQGKLVIEDGVVNLVFAKTISLAAYEGLNLTYGVRPALQILKGIRRL